MKIIVFFKEDNRTKQEFVSDVFSVVRTAENISVFHTSEFGTPVKVDYPVNSEFILM